MFLRSPSPKHRTKRHYLDVEENMRAYVSFIPSLIFVSFIIFKYLFLKRYHCLSIVSKKILIFLYHFISFNRIKFILHTKK